MTFAPLVSAGPIVIGHTIVALCAFAIGVVQLMRPKRGLSHKVLGYIWAALMLVIAGSSLFIHEIRMWGDFSPIHLLSVGVLAGVPLSVLAARRKNFKRHGRAMQQFMFWALLVTGLFTLYPGRAMHQVLFGG